MNCKIVAILILLAYTSSCLAISEGEKLAVSAMIDAWPILKNLTPPWDPKHVERACSAAFEGIICSRQSIIGLTLRKVALDGTIPSEIGQLQELQTLELTDNLLKGTIPDSIGQLTNLRTLQVWDNPNLNGLVPSVLWNLVNLMLVDIMNVNLYGTIPEAIGNLQELRHLSLVNAGLFGTIPQALGSLKHLLTLDLSNNPFFPCDFPETMASLPALYMVTARDLRLGSSTLNVLSNISTLTHVYLDQSQLSGTIPTAFSTFKRLISMSLSHNQLTGSIPAILVMGSLKFNNNALNGTLDNWKDFHPPITGFDCHGNQLTGTIPESLFRTNSLLLNSNRLTGPLPSSAFSYRELQMLDLSDNLIDGPLPNATLGASLITIDLSHNLLVGSVPASLRAQSELYVLKLGNNKLSGELLPFNNSGMASLELQNNNFSGTLPSFEFASELTSLLISQNHFHGDIPIMPKTLVKLDMGFNNFSGGLQNLYPLSNMAVLDLSNNKLAGSVPHDLLVYASSVNLAHNLFTGTIPAVSSGKLAALDLSNNLLSGGFPLVMLPSIISLKVSHNQLTGSISSLTMPYVSYLDISYNKFNFPFELISEKPLLVTFLAQHNHIYGSPTDRLDSMTSLTTIDISSNWLDGQLDVEKLALAFRRDLRELNLVDNFRLPTISVSPQSPIFRTTQRQPSPDVPNLMCYTLACSNKSGEYFRFDEPLFDWMQCDCTDGFFGLPPLDCFSCPSPLGCTSGELRLPGNSYIHGLPDFTRAPSSLLPTSEPAGVALPIFVESCLWVADSEKSNCKGLILQAKEISTVHDLDWNSQCTPGSRGRLCSECVCDTNQVNGTNSECYFMRGFQCVKCAKMYDTSTTIPFALGLVLAGIVLLSIPMYLVLRSKRRKKDTKWEELSIFARSFHRFMFALDLGFIPITVIFVQMLVELTHWDYWLIKGLSKLINGQTEATGISCVFPLMAKPLPKLLFRLFLPFAAAIAVSCSIGIAEVVTRIQMRIMGVSADQIEKIGYQSSSDPSSQSMHLMDDTKNTQEKKYLAYPATALWSTVMISVFQFFYFGTALAALEYFFYTSQPYTGLRYVQSRPWMKFSDASTLRFVSIPWLVLFVFGLPVAFVVFAIMVRDKISAPSLSIYFGTIFSRYKRTLFWWEIVNVLKKLIVAILVRAINPGSAMQSISVIIVLGVAQLLQTTRQPWKLQQENAMDHIGCLLLMLSLFASDSVSLLQASTAVYTTAALDITFIVANIAFLIYFAVTSKTPYQMQWDARFKSSDDPILAFTMPLFRKNPHSMAPPSIIIDHRSHKDQQSTTMEDESDNINDGPEPGLEAGTDDSD